MINIKGDIISNDMAWIYDWMEWEYTCPKQIEKGLNQANGDEVIFSINSGGGSVFDGYEIFNMIKSYSGKTTSQIIGMAASAASFIAMASDNVQAAALSQIMIHRASNGNRGNAPSHIANADFLNQIDNTIVKAYTMRNKKSDEEMIELMDKTTWFTADQAKEIGIVDEIINNEVSKPKVYNSIDNKQEIIDKIMELGSIENVKQALIDKNLGLGVVNSTLTNKLKEEQGMNLQDFIKNEPDLYNQIVKDTQEEAVKNERARIVTINALAKPGVEDQIKEGIENGLSAGDVAINILNAQTALNQAAGEAMKNDAENSGLENVDTNPTPQNTEAQDKEESINLLANAAKSILGGNI